jgi:pSer/pThr/pTyr-binding forkhead associated (FHA) protein
VARHAALTDAHSLNGTFVNGTRVTGEVRLGVGDELRIGGVLIVVRADS